jgi:hypothetical protein
MASDPRLCGLSMLNAGPWNLNLRDAHPHELGPPTPDAANPVLFRLRQLARGWLMVSPPNVDLRNTNPPNANLPNTNPPNTNLREVALHDAGPASLGKHDIRMNNPGRFNTDLLTIRPNGLRSSNIYRHNGDLNHVERLRLGHLGGRALAGNPLAGNLRSRAGSRC